MRRILALLIVIAVATGGWAQTTEEQSAVLMDAGKPVQLSDAHLKALERQRRVIFEYDVNNPGFAFTDDRVSTDRADEAIAFYMAIIDNQPNQIDSVWFEWGAGARAAWPSKVITQHNKHFPRWREAGIDPVGAMLEAAKERDLEVFFSYRVNDTDFEYDNFANPPKNDFRQAHPDWTFQGWPKIPNSMVDDFAQEGVREYKAAILREVAEMYDFDGIHIEFARNPTLFADRNQWLHRDELTDFIRRTRAALQEVAAAKGKPILLAVHVPKDIIGCHFDGMDVERWVEERLVDILVVGNRSNTVDVPAFKRITDGTPVEVYPSWDEHHASDGYYNAPLEVYRGVYSNFWSMEPDGVHTFNLCFPSPDLSVSLGLTEDITGLPMMEETWIRQCQIYTQIGDPALMALKDKTYYVERRGGGHGNTVFPDPEDWETPREIYFMSNMLAQLPAPLDNDGRGDTMLTMQVGDDIGAAPERIQSITLRIAISDPAAESLPAEERLPQIMIAPFGHVNNPPSYQYFNTPPAKALLEQLEVRINNLLLSNPRICGGWLFETTQGMREMENGWICYEVDPRYLAQGDNLLGIKIDARDLSLPEANIERVELHVDYK